MAVTRVLGASVQNKPILALLQAVGKIYWHIKRTHIFLKEQGKWFLLVMTFGQYLGLNKPYYHYYKGFNIRDSVPSSPSLRLPPCPAPSPLGVNAIVTREKLTSCLCWSTEASGIVPEMGEEKKAHRVLPLASESHPRMPSVRVKGEMLTAYITVSTVEDGLGHVGRLTAKSLSNDKRAGLHTAPIDFPGDGYGLAQ